MRSASAWAPPTSALPKKPPWTHSACSPSSQKRQVPSENANGITTRSPGFTVLTSAPISSTTPIASWPIGRPPPAGAPVLFGPRAAPPVQGVGRVDQLGVGHVLDADVPGAVHDGGSHDSSRFLF